MERQLVEETGIGRGQVKGHGAGGIIGDDTACEVARAAFPLAPAGPNDPGVEGQQQGNFPPALTQMALISAAFNLDRALGAVITRIW